MMRLAQRFAGRESRYLGRVLLGGSETVHNASARATRIRCFQDTDTLLIEFKDAPVAETRDLDENTTLDVDANGNICSITVEHASQRAGIPEFSFEQVAA